MALFHFDVRQIKRSAGQSAIACAAYRSGQKLYSDYYGEWSDYSRKGGVIGTEILLPDHAPREYADRQGIHKIPTIHEGPTVRAMERKGIRTEKGDFNRWVRATNKMMDLVREHLDSLTDWIGVLQSELDAPRPKSLAEVMNAYYDQRNAGAYSQRAKVNNLKEMSQMLIYLQENNIATLDDARLMVQEYNAAFTGMQSDLRAKGERLKELRKLLDHADTVTKLRPIYGEYRNIRFDKQKAKFKAEHEPELRKYFAARRELEKAFPKGSFDCAALEQELSQLESEYDEAYAQFRELKAGSDQMWKLKRILEADDRQNPDRYVAQGK